MKMKQISLISLFFLSVFLFFSFNISKAEAATLYFNDLDTSSNDWNGLDNWWTDASFTNQSLSLPTVGDDVVVSSGVDSNSGSAPSINTMVVESAAYLSISVTVANGATFDGLSVLYGNLVGSATFNNSSRVDSVGTITGNVIFNDTSENVGVITGDVTFYDSSRNRRIFTGFPPIYAGQIIGTAIFNESSVNQALVTGNATFNGSNRNANVSPATVTGDAIFNGFAFTTGSVEQDATFNDSSYNDGTILGNAIFNESSRNVDTIVGNATFNNLSFNMNAVGGNATFNDRSQNIGNQFLSPSAVVSGDASFFDLSIHTAFAEVSGNACFSLTATNNGIVGGTTSACAVLLPNVSSVSSNLINSTTALLSGLVNDTGGEGVSVGVEYGIGDFGSSVTNDGFYSDGGFSSPAAPLTCNTEYNFRAFATNSAGTDYGDAVTFYTGSCLSAGSVLYGVDGLNSNPNPPNLYTIDPATGDTTVIGPVGYKITGLAFDPTTGILYGNTGNAGSNQNSLFTINTTTGAGTLLGTIDIGGNPISMGDISFRSDGILYGASSDIYTIDKTCLGAQCLPPGALVGDSGLSTYGNGFAFDSNDNLYLFGDGDDNFYQMNPDTGAVISTNAFSNPSGNSMAIGAASFNNNDILFAPRLNYGNPPSDLVIIDVSSNSLTSLGDNVDMQYISALAFAAPIIVAPVVNTSGASTLTQTGATLNGEITDTGGEEDTERGFNWGLTNAYGTNVVQNSGPYNIGTFSTNLTGLTCGTTYHYRAYAINSAGTTDGLDSIFTTSACDEPESSGTTSGSRRANTTISIVTPTICPVGHLFNTTTGLPCTKWESSTTTPPSCVITQTLRQGDKGDQVKCLQSGLNILSDGIFGPMTKAAVVSFQQLHNLVPDGIFGPLSRAVWGKQ
jgi:peptidoglycan hydrolase-like protein with peptidoglycan-binding domain